jgi:hypothetical protein
MACEVTYYLGTGGTGPSGTGAYYGALLGSATKTLSASSESLGTVPALAKVARIEAGETCRINNNGAASPTAGQRLTAWK